MLQAVGPWEGFAGPAVSIELGWLVSFDGPVFVTLIILAHLL